MGQSVFVIGESNGTQDDVYKLYFSSSLKSQGRTPRLLPCLSCKCYVLDVSVHLKHFFSDFFINHLEIWFFPLSYNQIVSCLRIREEYPIYTVNWSLHFQITALQISVDILVDYTLDSFRPMALLVPLFICPRSAMCLGSLLLCWVFP